MGIYHKVHVTFSATPMREDLISQAARELLGKFDVVWKTVDGVEPGDYGERDIDFAHFSRTEGNPHYAVVYMLDAIANWGWNRHGSTFNWASDGKSLLLEGFLEETRRFFTALFEHHLVYAVWVMWQGEQSETSKGVWLTWRGGAIECRLWDLPDLVGFETALTAGEYEKL